MRICIVKFGSKTCGACLAMEKAKTLERLAENYKDVEIIKLDVADEDGNNNPGTHYDDAYKLSDEYEVESLPTLVFMLPDGQELLRLDEGVNYRQLEKTYEEAKELAEYMQGEPGRIAQVRKLAAVQKG